MVEHLEQFISKIIEAKLPNSARKSEDAKPVTTTQPVVDQVSELEYKTVDEVWDEKAHKYTIVKSLAPMGKIKDQDRYLFVVRHRSLDKETKDRTTYVDIKSKCLRDILRVVLQDVRGISLKEDKLSVEQNLLYTFLPELQLCHSLNDVCPADDTYKDHLELLIDCTTETYSDATQHLASLLQSGLITYNLLWALFKSNALVYTTCSGTHKPRCVRYNFGEEKSSKSGTKFWNLDCRYLDFNGEDFGSVSIELHIPKFRGTRRINTLEAFPLQYHADVRAARADLLASGQKFRTLIGSHHRHCRGTAFVMYDGEQIEVAIDSRIMVDAAFFRKMNPNYFRPTVINLDDAVDLWEAFTFSNYTSSHYSSSDTPSDETLSDTSSSLASSDTSSDLAADGTAPDLSESNIVEPAHIAEDDLLICCPTVPGFSFSDKLWAEFAVADIGDIQWSSGLYDYLTISDEQKEVIMALAEVQTSREPSSGFDDFVDGKGRGLNLLLHGPPGVGKTLTAEAVSEHLRQPLYSISAGELNVDAGKLEVQLSKIFRIASHWNAILLLDEADVFLERRSPQDMVRNGLVSVFLRKLEYCEGIIFLTTNLVSQFDDAILSRIHLMLRYDNLDCDARRQIWRYFLDRVQTSGKKVDICSKELERLACSKINGRQIKNIVATACALAIKQQSKISFQHLQKAVHSSEKFIREFNGTEHVDSVFF
ncbi:P-loop containing nucleoside triphosphate hydrolase protein [Halenospora varia]|nr:P-loop containing nucleoside triphosphate hydrolase protein [Halenospora varia]